jgi:hypothetical protein
MTAPALGLPEGEAGLESAWGEVAASGLGPLRTAPAEDKAEVAAVPQTGTDSFRQALIFPFMLVPHRPRHREHGQ